MCLWVTNRVGNFDLRGVLSFHFCRSSCPLVASTRSTHSRWKLIHQPCQSSGHKAVTTNIWTRLRSPNCAVRHALSCCTTKTTLNELDEDRLGSILKPFFIGQQLCLSNSTPNFKFKSAIFESLKKCTKKFAENCLTYSWRKSVNFFFFKWHSWKCQNQKNNGIEK